MSALNTGCVQQKWLKLRKMLCTTFALPFRLLRTSTAPTNVALPKTVYIGKPHITTFIWCCRTTHTRAEWVKAVNSLRNIFNTSISLRFPALIPTKPSGEPAAGAGHYSVSQEHRTLWITKPQTHPHHRTNKYSYTASEQKLGRSQSNGSRCRLTSSGI